MKIKRLQSDCDKIQKELGFKISMTVPLGIKEIKNVIQQKLIDIEVKNIIIFPMKKIKSQTNSEIISFIKSIYQNQKYIALHEQDLQVMKKYLKDALTLRCFNGRKVCQIVENKITNYTGAKYAIATSNGTSALHIALLLAEVGSENEVITQPNICCNL